MQSPFTQYAHPFEKRVNKFFNGVRGSGHAARTHNTLVKLMQQNLIVTNLWMERRFKNYRYLSKYRRRMLYQHSDTIAAAFDTFYQSFSVTEQQLRAPFLAHGVPFPEQAMQQLRCLLAITTFLQPGRYYHYIQSASFGKLLRDPSRERLEGDCNQIVTLYAYIYSRYFAIQDLQVKVLPDHVCLHFLGIDIEATSGQFTLYKEFDFVGPITELIAINLLDVSDFREMQAKVTEQTMLKAAELAFHLSSMRELVKRNLRVSYHNMALSKSQQNNFTSALFYAERSGNTQLVSSLCHNAALDAAKKNNFSKARLYAGKSGNTELQQYVITLEANSYLKKKQFTKARTLFSQVNNQEMVAATFQHEYNALYNKLPKNLRTIEDHKKYKATYTKLIAIAKKGGLTQQARQLQDLLKQL